MTSEAVIHLSTITCRTLSTDVYGDCSVRLQTESTSYNIGTLPSSFSNDNEHVLNGCITRML